MTVRVDATSAFEPNALVHCGTRLDPDAVEVQNPLIVVEVISPRTKAIDTGAKFTGYFGLDSVMHYVIVDARKRLVIHHRRATTVIETHIVTTDVLIFDPPGFTVALAEMFDDL